MLHQTADTKSDSPGISSGRTSAVVVLSAALFILPRVSLAQPADAARADRPNVVFILADDLGYGDISCFGGETCRIETPGFDRIAREGVRFTDAHSNASVCVPTRVAIMTGRYPWRFAAPEPGGPWGYLGLRFQPGQHTLGTMLRDAGYRTGYVGKWHLGTRMQTIDGRTQGPENVDYSRPLKVGPPEFGFDDSFILPGSLDMYPYAFVRNNQWVGEVTAQKGWSAFNRVGPAAADFEDVRVLDTFSREAERFISENAEPTKHGRPFFLYLALTAPHTPVSPSKKFEGRSPIGIYGDFVMETDDCVNRVLEALDQHGLTRNTLVIATSDHGPALYAGRNRKATFNQLRELEREGHDANGPFRGYKFSVYEGATRVPFVARWPGSILAAQTCDQLVSLSDVMATLAEAAELQPESDEAPDSISFLPLLRDPTGPPTRRTMILEATAAFAVREGAWKLALCPGSGCEGRFGNVPVRSEAWKAAVAAFGRSPRDHNELLQAPFVQLFDVVQDPNETNNMAADRPDIVKRLGKILLQTIDRGRTTPGPPLQNQRPKIALFPSVPSFVWQSGAGK